MLDTRESGIEFSREQIDGFTKIHDLYTNENRCIYAELLRSEDGLIVYLREWFVSHGSGSSFNFCVINSIDELRVELKKDADHGDIAPGKIDRICKEIADTRVFT